MRHLIHRHIGVRAEGMILAAAIWILVGVGVLTGPSPTLTPSVWHLAFPAWVRIALWWIPAIIAVILAPSERLSRWGLAALTLPPVTQGCSYLWAWAMDWIPGPPPGDPRGWLSACYYALMVAFVVLLAHIPASVRAPLTGRRR